MKYIKELAEYIERAVTPYHTVDVSKELLTKAGFEQLNEMDAWELKAGGKYFVSRNSSSIIAFTIPADGFGPFRIVAAHSDSPTFRIKENAEIKVGEEYTKLNTEGYGGSILYTWLDRPLGIAGRVFLDSCDGNGCSCQLCNGQEEVLLDFQCDMAVIPSLAIHMNREINDGYKWNKQVDMLPLWGGKGSEGSFRKAIAKAVGTTEDKILGSDLMLYCREEASVWGASDEAEFFSAPRLDDLACAFAGLTAITDSEVMAKHAKASDNPMFAGKINVCAIFDNEEVGSLTAQGADSTFLEDTLRRIRIALGACEEDWYRAVAGSVMLSADNAHAVHPNHTDKSDQNNRCFLNEGLVIKYSANQKYTTSGQSAAYLRKLCKEGNVPTQVFANRSDMAGGSTLGNISNAHISLSTVDIGIPQLAMHSAYETMGTADLGYMIDAMKLFYL